MKEWTLEKYKKNLVFLVVSIVILPIIIVGFCVYQIYGIFTIHPGNTQIDYYANETITETTTNPVLLAAVIVVLLIIIITLYILSAEKIVKAHKIYKDDEFVSKLYKLTTTSFVMCAMSFPVGIMALAIKIFVQFLDMLGG